MIAIHPAYDVNTRTWFVDGLAVEGKTISELLRRLPGGPSGYTVEGYYPGGWQQCAPISLPDTREKPKPRLFTEAWSAACGPRKESQSDVYRAQGGRLPKGAVWIESETVVKVLDMWAAGKKSPEIAAALGITERRVSAHI